MVAARLLRKLRLVARRGPRPDVKRDSGRLRFTYGLARASTRLSHLMFAGLCLVAMSPGVRGALHDERPDTAIGRETATDGATARRDAPSTVAEHQAEIGASKPDENAVRLPAAMVRRASEPAPSTATRSAPEPLPARPVAGLKLALADSSAATEHGSVHAAVATAPALRLSRAKLKRLKRVVARKVPWPPGDALRPEAPSPIVLASISEALPEIGAEVPLDRPLRVRQRGRERAANAVRMPGADAVRMAALSGPPAPADVGPIESVVKGALYTVVPAWSEADITTAKRVCKEVLASGHVVASAAQSVREGACGAPAPVQARKVGSPAVDIQPSALLTCPMAAAVDRWITEVVQPAALAEFGVPVVRLVSLSSYSCRNRYGASLGPLSEHALINAVDLAGFVLRDGRTVKVLDGWGPAARDKRIASDHKSAPIKVAEAKIGRDVPNGASMLGAGTLAAAGGKADRKSGTDKAKSKTGSDKEKPAEDGKAPRPAASEAAGAPGSKPLPADNAAAASEGKRQENPQDKPKTPQRTDEEIRAAFLHRVHGGACDLFGTVLGPDANEAHRNHFHLDMRGRRSKRGVCQ